MPTPFDSLISALGRILTGLFSSLTRKLCVLALDGTRVMRFDAQTGGFIDEFVAPQPQLRPRNAMCFGTDGHLLVPASKVGPPLPYALGVLRFSGTNGSLLDTFSSWPATAPGGDYDDPDCATIGPDGHLYAGAASLNSTGGKPIYRFNGKTGAFIGIFVPGGSGGLQCPGTLTFGPDGNLYVRNCFAFGPRNGFDILRFDGKTGAFIDVFVTLDLGQLTVAAGMAFGSDGHLYVGDYTHLSVLRYDGATGVFIDEFVPTLEANHPCGMTFGPEGDLYVANNGGGYSKPLYGNVSRYDGRTGALVQVYQRLGTNVMHPTDVLVTTMDIPFPNFSVGPDRVPRWLWVLAAVGLGTVIGRSIAPPASRNFRR